MSRFLFTNLFKSNSYKLNTLVMSKKNKNTQKKEAKEVEIDEPIKLNKNKEILISILAKPGAKQNSITGISLEGVGVQINAPPSEGEANTELVKYMASILGLRKSDVVFEKGFKSRSKTLRIIGEISLEDVRKKIQNEINS